MSDFGIITNLPPANPIDMIEPSQNTNQKRKDNKQSNGEIRKKDQRQKKSKDSTAQVALSKLKPVIDAKKNPDEKKRKKGELVDIRV
jgi:hypothetical protein